MKKIRLPFIIVLTILTSCSHNGEDPSNENWFNDHEIFFKTSGGLEYQFNDFDFYDSSAHMFYFRENHGCP